MVCVTRSIAVNLVLGACLTVAPVAWADPPALPGPPPWIPEVPGTPYQGTGSYLYNYIDVPPPALVDARGVNIGTNADAGQQLQGLPGDKLGNGPRHPNALTSANTIYGIEGGTAPAATLTLGEAISAGATDNTMEKPSGQQPAVVPGCAQSPASMPASDRTHELGISCGARR
jgi:hypothetical protein